MGSDKTGLELAAELKISKAVVSKARRGEMKVFRPAGMFTGLMQAGA